MALKVRSDTLSLKTRGHTEVVDITEKVQAAVSKAGLREGIVTIFVPGSTGGLTTIEYEPGLVKDIREVLDAIAPPDRGYHHHEAWGDDNGHSHVRAALVGPSLTVPFSEGRLTLGTWQQIVFLDFDTRPRDRELRLQLLGTE